jgi:long-chain fatty acid transport protein
MAFARFPLRICALAAACIAGPALATNGYFPHGYGMKAKGMAGASTAMAQDSMGGATNPASMAFAGPRMDLGVDVFMPKRDAERTGSGPGLNGKIESDKTSFFVPEFGVNLMFGSDMTLGLTVYGNGGMNTTYPQGNFQCPTPGGPVAGNMLCGGGELGVDLMQLIIAPTFTYKINPQHAVGVSLLLGYQRFKASGLQAFDNPPSLQGPGTTAVGSVTNNGYDSATGFGLRLGYQGRITDAVSIGVAYAPKMNMGKFEKYKGLFAEGGDFDIPSHYSVGVAFKPTPAWTIAFDAGRINYSDVASVNNTSFPPVDSLGAANGQGFGWKDINVYKLGVAWAMSDALTLRAGYNKGDNPIKSNDVTFNILAPGVMTTHYTAGFTFGLDKQNEITGMFMMAPRQTVTGTGQFFGGSETIGMKQTSIGLAWGRKF